MKYLKTLLSFCLIFLFFLILNIPDTKAETNNLNFSMDIIQPENQINKNITYFDIMTNPNETQQLQLKVSNLGKTKETMQIIPTNAITNSSGLIDYSEQNSDYKYDDTLRIKFTSLISDKQEITLEPGESKIVTFQFQAPDDNFSGIILGGFLAKIKDDDNEKNINNNVSFINKFQLVKAIVIRNSNKEIVPKLKLNDVKPTLYTYRTAVSANIQNTTPILLKNITIKTDVLKAGSTKIIKSETRQDVELAPNSNFDFPIMWGNEPLKPGEYTLKMVVITKQKEFKFEKDFTISKEDSYNINKKAIDLESINNSNLFEIFIILIVFVIILLLSYYIYKKKNKNKKNKNKKNKNKKNKNKKNKNKKKLSS